jgi:hypothetical protein
MLMSPTENICYVITTHCCGVKSLRMRKLRGHEGNAILVLLAVCRGRCLEMITYFCHELKREGDYRAIA